MGAEDTRGEGTRGDALPAGAPGAGPLPVARPEAEVARPLISGRAAARTVRRRQTGRGRAGCGPLGGGRWGASAAAPARWPQGCSGPRDPAVSPPEELPDRPRGRPLPPGVGGRGLRAAPGPRRGLSGRRPCPRPTPSWATPPRAAVLPLRACGMLETAELGRRKRGRGRGRMSLGNAAGRRGPCRERLPLQGGL